MYCPKCGTQNSDQARFCRGCGVDLQPVAQALTGIIPVADNSLKLNPTNEKKRRDEYEKALKNLILGIGFLIVSAAVYFLVPGGFTWFYAFLFPAFACGASGFVKLKSYKEERLRLGSAARDYAPPLMDPGLPPRRQSLFSEETQPANFAAPSASSYPTTPASITEETTRQLVSVRPTDRMNEQ